LPEIELLGTSFLDLFDRSDRPALERLLALPTMRAATSGERSTTIAIGGRMIAVSRLTIAGRGDDALTVVVRDVTDRIRSDAALAAAQDTIQRLTGALERIASLTADLKKRLGSAPGAGGDGRRDDRTVESLTAIDAAVRESLGAGRNGAPKS
jgi:hypothetical protein